MATFGTAGGFRDGETPCRHTGNKKLSEIGSGIDQMFEGCAAKAGRCCDFGGIN
jgi:hypothetical protein